MLCVVTEPASRRRLDAEARRRQLIDVGLEVLSREPREQVATDRIAEAAGISRGLLFHYFPTKRAYHVAVVQAAADRLLEVITPDPEMPPRTRLRQSLVAYIGFVSANEALYVSLVRGAAGRDDGLREIFEKTRAEIVERVVGNLGLHSGPPLLQLALYGWIGFVEESTLDWLRRRDVPREQLVGLQEEVLLRAVAPAGVTV